jgi:hypothetical protein
MNCVNKFKSETQIAPTMGFINDNNLIRQVNTKSVPCGFLQKKIVRQRDQLEHTRLVKMNSRDKQSENPPPLGELLA